jgi:uncharacterized protein
MFEYVAHVVVRHLDSIVHDSHAKEALHFFIMDTLKIFALLIVAVYIMGLFRTLLSPERVREYIQGRSKILAHTLAILLGAVTPFCSCSSVPLFIGFVEAGIPLGVTFSFLIASPIINEVAVVLLIGVLGWKVALLYVISGLIIAYLGGILIERFRLEKWIESYVWDIQVGATQSPSVDTSFRGRHAFATGQVKEIVGRIWLWVLIGVGVGALFHGYVPQSWMESLSDKNNFLAVPMAVVLGVPLYSNAVGVIPLAQAMLAKGVAVGTALALMMSVAAISLPELLILRKVIRLPGLLIFILVLTVSIVLMGWVLNILS